MVGETFGRRGRAGQETLPEPAEQDGRVRRPCPNQRNRTGGSGDPARTGRFEIGRPLELPHPVTRTAGNPWQVAVLTSIKEFTQKRSLPSLAGQPRSRAAAALFTITSFLAAALLFLAEPMIARMVLPQFGGSPAVWTTCMLFFQTLLLAGYAYAHAAWRLGGRKQVVPHLVLLLGTLVVLPISVSTAWAPRGQGEPAVLLLGLLLVSAGLPFFVVATSAPLLQAWYAALGRERGRDPYWLYAASNAGSLLGLLGYPLLMEPMLTVRGQSWVWAAGYAALVLLCGACAVAVARAPAAAAFIADERSEGKAPSFRRRARWIALSFLPSSLMLGVTAHLTTDVPPVPMLWIAPLSLYLLSFVLSFASPPFPPRRWVIRMMGFAVVLQAYLLIDSSLPYTVLCAALLLGFFVLALGFHGELAHDRPGTGDLTGFYLCLAVGGALGGLFNSLAAPRLFSWVAEYPLSLAAAGLLLPTLRPAGRGKFTGLFDVAVPAGLGAAAAAPLLGELRYAVPTALCLLSSGRPLRLGLGLAAILGAWHFQTDREADVVHRERSFFGVLRVVRSGPLRNSLFHGYVCHGSQVLAADRRVRDRPLLYYHPTGPIGQVFADVLAPRPAHPVGLVGLGVGSLASYGRPGQELSFFEIDPAVARIARDERFFTYLKDSPAACRIVIGDARLTLQGEPDGKFGMIVVDAFSGDMIPVHLLTREALRIYLDKLAEGGLIAFHITNSCLDIEPEIAALARSESLTARVRGDGRLTPKEAASGKEPSHWAILARQERDLGPLAFDRRWQAPRTRPGLTAWSDDFSNPLALVRWR